MAGLQFEDLDESAQDLWSELALRAAKAGFGEHWTEHIERGIVFDARAAGKAAFDFHKANN